MDLSPDRLLTLLRHTPDRPMSLREIMERLRAPRGRRKMVYNALMALVHEGRLVKLRKRNFALPRNASRIAGRIHVSTKGAGYVLGAAPNGEDLFVHQRNVGDALDGDVVEVEILQGSKGPEGRIAAVRERAHESLVGQLRHTGRGGMVTPRNIRINRWVEVREAPPRNELPDGTWVQVRITRWSADPESPLLGEIEEVLGRPGERGLPVLLLLRDMGIDVEFPEKVEREAANCKSAVEQRDESPRRDLTAETVFTIDPATAKDFDDAISCARLPQGGWRLGVHIADVAHFVRPDTKLDAEARRRATSIYPVDRVVPMLPEYLSNDLCSLRPREDRLAMSCIMDISPRGEVVRHEICNSLIHSRHRLNYRQVQDFFNAPDKLEHLDFADIADDLSAARNLARVLLERRMERGALDLDLPETEVVCDAQGDTVAIRRHERHESNRLIEECMLIANETVARHLHELRLPCLYRIHDIPDPGALEKAAPALALFGVQVPRKIAPDPKAYQPLIDALHGRDGAHIAQRLLLRSLMRAEYNTTNRGHFGLASKCYCHFTSPIRRYPDLIVHRILKDWMAGRTDTEGWAAARAEELPLLANHCNVQSDAAEVVEREATQIKSMEFMADHVGDIFEGWVSGIARRGFFVELVEMPVEGFVAASSIGDDYYAADQAMVRFTGRRSGKCFALGHRLRVQVVRVGVVEGEMELALAEDTAPRQDRRKHHRGGGKKALSQWRPPRQ